ncbi:TadE/TadG family type IV pilus assembly protein [Herbaspirillum sp. RV1423]|uniref:TadE/TadG family type IV pilus assembly protein n=1 Tax=Herbaspirillum sp. RV1423 TaxID=1443993 RepID=UPI0004B1FB87|nr:TadE/TadG family type IV pilus assembly protein [Herbaspirillum sp. RV1423]
MIVCHYSRLHRRHAGSIAVEFAVVIPIILLVLVLIVESMRIQVASILLERALYDISYQTRIARGRDFPAIARRVLAAGNFHVFNPADVTVQATSASSVGLLPAQGAKGAGRPGDVVKLTLHAKLGLFGALFTERLEHQLTLTLLSVNESDY